MSYFIYFFFLCSMHYFSNLSEYLMEGLGDLEEVILNFHFDFHYPCTFYSVSRQQDCPMTCRKHNGKNRQWQSHVSLLWGTTAFTLLQRQTDNQLAINGCTSSMGSCSALSQAWYSVVSLSSWARNQTLHSFCTGQFMLITWPCHNFCPIFPKIKPQSKGHKIYSTSFILFPIAYSYSQGHPQSPNNCKG